MQLIVPFVGKNGSYSTGKCVGGVQALTPANGYNFTSSWYAFAVSSAVLTDLRKNNVLWEAWLMTTVPTGTWTDDTLIAPSAADLKNTATVIDMSGIRDGGTNGGVIKMSPIYERVKLVSAGLWVGLVTRGAPSFTGASGANSELQLRLTLERVKEDVR